MRKLLKSVTFLQPAAYVVTGECIFTHFPLPQAEQAKQLKRQQINPAEFRVRSLFCAIGQKYGLLYLIINKYKLYCNITEYKKLPATDWQ